MYFEGVGEESLAKSEDLSQTLPCFEVVDKGDKADETLTNIDLVSLCNFYRLFSYLIV